MIEHIMEVELQPCSCGNMEPMEYASSPMGRATMYALKHLIRTTVDANEAAHARTIHDHIGAAGIRQDDFFCQKYNK